MTVCTVDEVIAAWTAPLDERQAQDPEAYQESMRVTDLMLQLLAEGEPVSARHLAQAAGVPLAEYRRTRRSLKEKAG